MYVLAVDGQREYGKRLYLEPGSHDLEFIVRHRHDRIGVRRLKFDVAGGRTYLVRAELLETSFNPYGWRFQYWIEDKADGRRIAEGTDRQLSADYSQRTWYFDGGPEPELSPVLDGEPATVFFPPKLLNWAPYRWRLIVLPEPIIKKERDDGAVEWHLRPGSVVIEIGHSRKIKDAFYRTTTLLQPGHEYEVRLKINSWGHITVEDAWLYDKTTGEMVSHFSRCWCDDISPSGRDAETFYECEETRGADVIYRQD